MKQLTTVLTILLLPAVGIIQPLQNTPPEPAIVPSALIGWWPGEGNALDSADGHHGMVLFGMNYGLGVVGRAFDFDGTSRNRISIPDNPEFNLTDALTIEGWIFPRKFGGGGLLSRR